MADERAFWISPTGTIYPVGISHIAEVIRCPERFGLERTYLEAVYRKHMEPMGLQGKAREEIVKALLERNWCRVREYRDYLSIQLLRLDHASAHRLISFFSSVQYPLDLQIRLGVLSEQRIETTTVADLEERLALMANPNIDKPRNDKEVLQDV